MFLPLNPARPTRGFLHNAPKRFNSDFRQVIGTWPRSCDSPEDRGHLKKGKFMNAQELWRRFWASGSIERTAAREVRL